MLQASQAYREQIFKSTYAPGIYANYKTAVAMPVLDKALIQCPLLQQTLLKCRLYNLG